MYSSSTPTVYGGPAPKRWSRTLGGGCELGHQIGSGSHLDRAGRAFLHAQRAALAVVEVERVGVRAAAVELDHGVVGADAVAVVAGEAAAAGQAAAGLEQRRGGVEAAGDLFERGLAARELERRAHGARRVVVVPRVERLEAGRRARRLGGVVLAAQVGVDPARGVRGRGRSPP